MSASCRCAWEIFDSLFISGHAGNAEAGPCVLPACNRRDQVRSDPHDLRR